LNPSAALAAQALAQRVISNGINGLYLKSDLLSTGQKNNLTIPKTPYMICAIFNKQ